MDQMIHGFDQPLAAQRYHPLPRETPALGVGIPRKALDTSLVRPELAYIDRVEVGSFTVVEGRMANHEYPGVFRLSVEHHVGNWPAGGIEEQVHAIGAGLGQLVGEIWRGVGNANQVFNWLKNPCFAARPENNDAARFLPVEIIDAVQPEERAIAIGRKNWLFASSERGR